MTSRLVPKTKTSSSAPTPGGSPVPPLKTSPTTMKMPMPPAKSVPAGSPASPAEPVVIMRDVALLVPLAFVANLKARFEIEKRRRSGSLNDGEKRELVRVVAKELGMSERNAARYVHAAHAPPELQEAHRNGHLRLTLAARAGMLPRETQLKIVASLAAAGMENAEAVVASHLSRPTNRRTRLMPVIRRLTRNLRRDLADLGGKFELLYGPDLAPHRAFLYEARAALDQLIAAAERPGVAIAEAFKVSAGRPETSE